MARLYICAWNRNVGSRLYNLHAIVPVSVFGLSTPFRVFHDPLLAATEQAATCDARPSDRLCILAIILSLCGGPATEQANKSGGTLATIQSIHDAAEKTHMFVKDEHHCRRAFLLASHEIVRSGSNGKQGWQT